MKFRNLSIRNKLTVLMMVVSVLMLSLVGGLYVAEEIYSSRAILEREMTSLGTALGESCKKLLMLREIKTTQEILSSFATKSNVKAAYLFDDTGKPVAQYLDPDQADFVIASVRKDFPDETDPFWVKLYEPKLSSSKDHFALFLPILHEGRPVGSIYLLSDLRELYGRLNGVGFSALILLGACLLLSWWLAGKLQKPVSEPILELVGTMETISKDKDFSLRAVKQGQDEVGHLVDGFNQMLERIAKHRQELLEHQQSLELTVQIRTEELRQMVAVLEVAKYQAEAASEAKSQFLANITHELRTPLIGVLGMNELLFRTSMDEQQEMLATTVQNSGENLLTLINNVLDFSKIEAGKMQLEETEFSLYRVLDDVLNLLAGAAGEKGLSLYSHIPVEATCRVVGDEVRVRQILTNLIGNAIKFTEQGSVAVHLNCDENEPGRADFHLEVNDTGIGMDKAAQEQIFSAFYQADTSHTRKFGGTGLGLAIVMQLVKLLEGRISLDSAPAKGSRFKIDFSLPIAGKNVLRLPDNLVQQPVLVFVDDPICREELGRRLTSLGLNVTTSASVADAWYQVQSAARNNTPFQMAFFNADSALPDGQLLCQAIREDQVLSRMRRTLLLRRSDSAVSKELERKLYLPFSWDSLCDTIIKSWHELHLVENPDAGGTDQDVIADKSTGATILFAGGSVASRELVKITLASLPITIDVAANMAEFEEKLAEGSCVACLVDLSNMSVEPLVSAFQQIRVAPPLYLLSSPATDLTSLDIYVEAVLEKPFTGEELVKLFTPLSGIVTEAKAADDEGARV